jgi:hypothetical protein
MGRSHISDKALKQAILFFGAVSFFLGKKALEGADAPALPAARVTPDPDPVLMALRSANQRRAA